MSQNFDIFGKSFFCLQLLVTLKQTLVSKDTGKIHYFEKKDEHLLIHPQPMLRQCQSLETSKFLPTFLGLSHLKKHQF